MEAKRLSPLQAIKKYCYQCSGESYKEAKLCVIPTCPLFPFRLGKSGRATVLTPERRAELVERCKTMRSVRVPC